MLDANPVYTPLPTACKMVQREGKELSNPGKYRRLIVQLLYLMVTRPDITFATQQLSQFMDKPTEFHCRLGMRIRRYFRGTQNLQLVFNPSQDPKLTTYSDSD